MAQCKMYATQWSQCHFFNNVHSLSTLHVKEICLLHGHFNDLNKNRTRRQGWKEGESDYD